MLRVITVLTILGYSAVVSEARCGFNASLVCFKPPPGQPNRPNFFETGLPMKLLFRAFDQDIKASCDRMTTMKTCVTDAVKDCDPDNDNPVKKFWDRAVVGINILCVEKIEAFNAHRACLTSAPVKTALTPCFDILDTHHTRRRRHTCDDFTRAMKCSRDVIQPACGDQTSKDMDSLLNVMLTNNVHLQNCKTTGGGQGGSGTSGSSSGVIITRQASPLVLLALLGYFAHVVFTG